VSHVAVVNCIVKDLEALGKACAKKNARLNVGAKTFKSFSTERCEHSITLLDNPKAFEVGLLRDPKSEGWKFGFDDYGHAGRALVDRFGEGLEVLQNEYLAVIAEDQLRRDGFMVERLEAGQRIELVALA
jgi:hypothetical protein